MIIAYQISLHDGDQHMISGPTYRPSPDAGFHDWRFGKDGVAHPATCPNCGTKTDPTYVDPTFRVKRRSWDIFATYDGYHIVSARFRRFCEEHGWHGMNYAPLPADHDFFVLRVSIVVAFDAGLRAMRFERPCPTCGRFYDVVGATPVFLRGLTSPIADGFFRSDLEFASGPEQSPLILVGVETAQKLKEKEFRKYDLRAVEA